MFAAPVFVGAMMVAMASDPLAVVQSRYPAARTTVTTASGVYVYYTLPADSPADLKRAYKVLEVAERDVILTEALQLLEQEYVQNERRLEALRTARTATYLTNTMYGTRGPMFYSSALLSPPEPAIKWVLLGNLARGTTADRALAAIDRMAGAQYQLQQTLLDLAYPDRAKPAAVPVAAPPAPRSGHPAAGDAAAGPASAREAEQAAARAETAAEERERAARTKELAAEERYRASLPAEREAARKAWLEAREQWEQARRDWDAARERWQTARDQLDAPRLRQPQPPAEFVPPVGYRPGAPVVPAPQVRVGTAVRRRSIP